MQEYRADLYHLALVTGGGSGVGAMFAAAYVQNGAKVYIASRKEKQLREVRIHFQRDRPLLTLSTGIGSTE